MIRVLVADDSALAREVLTRRLASDDQIEVIGTAVNGREAVKMAGDLKPDIITMDIMMPEMNGFEATKEIMAYAPTPILVVTGIELTVAELSFKALDVGALDILPKPAADEMAEDSQFFDDLRRKVRLLSKVPVIAHVRGRRKPADDQKSGTRAKVPTKVVALAASTGGPQHLADILSRLPANLPAAYLVVQHIGDGFSDGLITHFLSGTALEVKLAHNGDIIEPGSVYVAPNGYHLVARRGDIIGLEQSEPVSGFIPSATPLFQSVARIYGKRAIGVMLTGMGRDGVEGMQAIRDEGGVTIAQSKESCIVFGMPKAAIEAGCVDHIVDLDDIPQKLISLVEDPFAWHKGEGEGDG
ncbi:MAG: chemotaxis-specific protein-glutamate methyltransferase CheB [Planctomycetota bacterium]|nr:chemotaxis-specific protein-glutamate methyltransferase CheB [Planctomycetota bacterium]MDP6504777.1 chemotaxis-specific protein-glutamate methyltransferase CheB [Planctomycetota bacterium]